ncbi:MAG: [Fe-Fe] hydrogenase large subunit C-terminal domain-containing protein [Bacteroidota bacterium]
MENEQFQHALIFREDICIGCSHCMMICPTEAIRVKNGKAQLMDNRCVDCGECYRVCPVGAIIVHQDDFNDIFAYKHRIALIPSVFTGQFPEKYNHKDILDAVYELGFTDVYEVEQGAPFLAELFNEQIQNKKDIRPLISPFCPAIVRLIQVKFPTLIDHLIPLKAPLDITALHARKVLSESGINPKDIGVFYVTPCAAKIVAIKNPVGETKSAIDGVINMNYLFNKIFKYLKSNPRKGIMTHQFEPLSPQAVKWSLTRGETDFMKDCRSLAIDEISNVIEFLEKVENEEIKGVDFLELRACDESCAGGILCSGNRFLTVDKLQNRASKCDKVLESEITNVAKSIAENSEYLRQNANIGEIPARSMLKLDDNMADAMAKMKRIYEINRSLPQVDCGICGTPSCQSLAEDIVQQNANIKQCVFVQKILEQNDKLESGEAIRIMKSIWSDNKLDKNSFKD